MPQRGFQCIVDLDDRSFDACIACAANLGRCQMTAGLLRGMADQARRRQAEPTRLIPVADVVGAATDADLAAPGAAEAGVPDTCDASHQAGGPSVPSIPPLSVTALTGCARQSYLKATEEYYQRPDQQYWAYRGTLAHLLVERGAAPGTIAERRFERALRLPTGRVITITGQPDEIDPTRSLLLDYKTTDRPPKVPSPLHVAQLNVYRWLVAPEYSIDKLGIVYLTMKSVKKVGVPIWPDGQVERYLHERAGALADAYAGGPWPELTEDRWLCQFCPVSAVCERGPVTGALPADDPLSDDAEPRGAADEPRADTKRRAPVGVA